MWLDQDKCGYKKTESNRGSASCFWLLALLAFQWVGGRGRLDQVLSLPLFPTLQWGALRNRLDAGHNNKDDNLNFFLSNDIKTFRSTNLHHDSVALPNLLTYGGRQIGYSVYAVIVSLNNMLIIKFKRIYGRRLTNRNTDVAHWRYLLKRSDGLGFWG